jgi:hypothetical protein
MRNHLAARLLEGAAQRQRARVSPRDGGGIFLALALTFLACGEAPPPAGGPVVLVVIDTLRADHLGLYGHERDTSPELDAWAVQGRVYERVWSTSSWTLPSVASLLTGRLPSSHGAVALVPLPNDNPLFGKLPSGIPTLAQRFGSAGYATAAFVTNPYLKPLLGLDRGEAILSAAPPHGPTHELRRAAATAWPLHVAGGLEASPAGPRLVQAPLRRSPEAPWRSQR